VLGVDEVGWMLAKHLLIEMAVQKSVGHIQLVSRPLLGGDDGQDGSDRCRLDDG